MTPRTSTGLPQMVPGRQSRTTGSYGARALTRQNSMPRSERRPCRRPRLSYSALALGSIEAGYMTVPPSTRKSRTFFKGSNAGGHSRSASPPTSWSKQNACDAVVPGKRIPSKKSAPNSFNSLYNEIKMRFVPRLEPMVYSRWPPISNQGRRRKRMCCSSTSISHM